LTLRSREAGDYWASLKAHVERLIRVDSIIGYLDPGILGILRRLNSLEGLATTSSCIGRITFIEGERHWDRSGSRIVYKTHTRITAGALKRVLSRPFPSLWLKVSGPILHVKTVSVECALHLLEKARRHGFKHSGILSVERGGEAGYTSAVVEIMSSIDVAIPLRIKGENLVSFEDADKMASTLNALLLEGRRRLEGLADDLFKDPGPCGPVSSQNP